MDKATFAAGCFWGVEEAFSKVKGVVSTRVGYTGGKMVNPGYYDVTTGTTGHAESVELEYDPTVITYKELLDVFWKIHDPTTKDRQGPDIGSQYRSAIFYHSDEQKDIATASREEIDTSGRFRGTITTEIKKATEFYPAEEYHQKYFEKNSCGLCFKN